MNSKARTKKISRIVYIIIIAAALLLFLHERSGIQQNDTGTELSASEKGEVISVHYIDVGQASCTLILAGDNRILIDAGTYSSTDKVREYLADLGVQGEDALDLAVFTHPHSDHIGGAVLVMKKALPKEILLAEFPEELTPTGTSFENLLKFSDERDIPISMAQSGMEYRFRVGEKEAVLTVLGPVIPLDSGLNGNSIVCRLDYGNASFLFPGDATSDEEETLIDSGCPLKADVYQVSHHGSYDANSKKFLEQVSPKYAVISCGADNDYGYPHKVTMERLADAVKIKVLRTDLNGTIVVATDGERYEYRTEKGE